MSRLQNTFQTLAKQQKKALIPFLTAGDPALELTLPLLKTLAENGADIIELGVPFSDPIADGEVIQKASERALEKGVTLSWVLKTVSEFRKHNTHTPIVLMGYANPIEQMGITHFVREASNAGVDGILVVDYPPEESEAFASALRNAQIDPIFLLAPTSTQERILQIAKLGAGYIYYVSLRGVTGAAHFNVDEVKHNIAQIRSYTELPLAVGFGIRDAKMAQQVAQIADGVVIGSQLINELQAVAADQVLNTAAQFVSTIQKAING